MNTIHAPSILNSPASASWVPVCLPKFNPAGFVNAYISFLRKGEEEAQQVNSSRAESRDGNAETPMHADAHPGDTDAGSVVPPEYSGQRNPQGGDSGIALVCISGGGEFETVRTWCDTVINVRVTRNREAWTHE
jgi:vacuolar fusion protein MON1